MNTDRTYGWLQVGVFYQSPTNTKKNGQAISPPKVKPVDKKRKGVNVFVWVGSNQNMVIVHFGELFVLNVLAEF